LHPLIFSLKRAYLATKKTIDTEIARYDLTSAQLDVLMVVHHFPNLEQRDLQSKLGITSATLTKILDGMESRAYLTRTPSPTDSRVRRICLTEVGIHLLETLHQTEQRLFQEMFAKGFSPVELEILNAWLQRVAKNMGDTSQNLP
jgi:DNA-binding MarR family transcriptional regulator